MATRKGVTRRITHLKPPVAQTNVVFVVDSSGSMGVFRQQVVDNYTALLGAVPRGDKVRNLVFSWQVHEVPAFRTDTYFPDGNTALYDAVWRGLDFLEDSRLPGLLIVLTDGCENASSTSVRNLADRIRRMQEEDKYTIVFQVPFGSKRKLMQDLHLFDGNVVEWEQTQQGFERVSHDTYTGTQSYFLSRALGETATKSFYSGITDLSALKTTDLQSLDVLQASAVKVWTVGAESDISGFVQQQGYPYRAGSTFYQLTKPETIQTYKSLLLMEKGKRQVYGGKNIRNLLGLPSHLDMKLTPGNHANYDIFVESRSHNRKLVRGTKVIYKV